MKGIFRILFLVFVFHSNSLGQGPPVQELIDEGIRLHDKGDFTGAIKQFEKALKVDKQSPIINYELANTYFAMGHYPEAIEYCDKVINDTSVNAGQAYVVKGSSLDLMGKTEEAIASYKLGINEDSLHFLLPFNLALTYFNQQKYLDAETYVQSALRLNPSHANSHILLATVMNEQGKRAQAVLAIFNFLLLEPEGRRANATFEFFETLIKSGIKNESDQSIGIHLEDKDVRDGFIAGEIILSAYGTAVLLETNKGKTDQEVFIMNTNAFFEALEMRRDGNSGFFWEFYVDFYNAMSHEGHLEAFTYFISQSKGDKTVKSWLEKNTGKIEKFAAWYGSYDRR